MKMRMLVAMLVMMMMVVVFVAIHQHIKLHRTEIRSRYTRHLQLISLNGQLTELSFQVVEAEPEIQQCANRHVAADAGEAVEVERPHGL